MHVESTFGYRHTERCTREGHHQGQGVKLDNRVLHRRHPRLVHRQQRHPGPQYPNHVSRHRLSSHESLSGSADGPRDSWRAIRPHIRPGASTSPANPATTATMPKQQKRRQIAQAQRVRRSAPTRVELPLLRGQPGTTRRVFPLLATRSHDRGKTRLKRSHERGKRQCAARMRNHLECHKSRSRRWRQHQQG